MSEEEAVLEEVLPGEALPGAEGEAEAEETVAGEGEEVVKAPTPGGYDRNRVLELGDRVLIDYEEDTRVWGIVYYRDNELLRLRPDMPGNTLIDFPREYAVDDRIDRFQEDLNVRMSYILKKRDADHPDFVTQQNFQVGQTLAGILEEGKPGPTYIIRAVNTEEDWIDVQNTESEEEERINFRFCGIPLDLDIQILRIAAAKKAEGEAVAEGEAEGEAAKAATTVARLTVPEEGEGAADEDALFEEDEDIVDGGYIYLPQQQVLKEAEASKKIIPENLQKADAINDFLNMLPATERKNPKQQRSVRILVELLHHMKRAITTYKPDGTVKGVNQPSASTLLELIEKAEVPMGRPVLDMEKRLFDMEDSKSDKKAYPESTRNSYFLEDDPMAKKGSSVGPSPFSSAFIDTQGDEGTQVNYYMEKQIEYEKERPWKRGQGSGPEFPILHDTFVFRSNIPDLDSPSLEGLVQPGSEAIASGDFADNFPQMGIVPYGIEVALATTYRKGPKSQKLILFSEESAPLNYYLLFPQIMASFLGSKRSGSLPLDAMRAKVALGNMLMILVALGPILDANPSNKIVPLKVEGGTLNANIPITDYLEGLELVGEGIGDLLIDLSNYGFNQLEFTPAIYTVLQKKILKTQAHLNRAINALRDSIPKIPDPLPSPMLPIETTPILDTLIRTHAILVEGLNDFESQNPTLVSSDIARVAYFLKYYRDYWSVAIGQQPEFVDEERIRTIKTVDLERIQIEQTIASNNANKGVPPKPNTCEHVAKLVTIRKLKDENEKYLALTKFLAHYQGGEIRDDNWIPCNVCRQNLLCVHERLLIMAFLSPLEKEVLFKKLFLNFSGGVFQGFYICRCCGQPIQEIGLDTSIQFDKQGRPVSGQAALQTKGGITIEDIEKILVSPIANTDELEFKDPEQAAYYAILRELAERVGIYMPRDRYEDIIDSLTTLMGDIPNREKHAKREARYKKKNAAYKVRDYDAMVAKITICGAALYLLYEIQTHIPEYVPQYSLPGCDAGFGGYPLDENLESVQGLTYMACAIASIRKEEEPWSTANFFTYPKGGKEGQIREILEYMAPVLQQIEASNITLERRLDEKRIWISQLVGKPILRLKDTVPETFLPELVLPTVAEAAAEPIVAMDARTLARAWIRNAHDLARRNSKPVRGSPFMDLTCCKIPIRAPGSFWASDADLSAMPLKGRQLTPLQRAPNQQVTFEPRSKEALVVEIPKGLTYRLFLKVCFKGDRIGMSHEPGVTNRCHSCGFQFPVHPKILDPDEAQTAIGQQGIDTSLETFETLLTTVREKNTVEPLFLGEPEEWRATLRSIRKMTWPPLDDWELSFGNMIERLRKRQKELKKGDTIPPGTIAEVLAEQEGEEVPLATAANAAKEAVEASFTKIKFTDPRAYEVKRVVLERMSALPWHNFIQVLETYFLRVGKNLLNKYNIESVKDSYDDKRLAKITLQNIVESFDRSNAVYAKYSTDFQANTFARAKLAKYLAQITEIIQLKNRIRPSYFVGDKAVFKWIQMAFFYGPLAELFDSSIVPFEDLETVPGYILPVFETETTETTVKKGSARESINDKSIKLLLKIINDCVNSFHQYQLSYNDDELKQVLEERAEREKQVMIGSMLRMSAEQKAIYKQQRALGLGQFGINVIKQVVNYDKEQTEKDTEIIKQAGLATSLAPANEDEMENEGFEGEGFNQGPTEEEREAAEGFDLGGALGGASEFDGEEDEGGGGGGIWDND
jgi:hypothetical protein